MRMGGGWVDEVPEGWTMRRLKYAAAVNPPTRPPGSPADGLVSFLPMEAVGEYGGLDLSIEKGFEAIGSGYTRFQDGDVLIAKITPCFENGKGAIARNLVNGFGCGTTELHVLRPAADTEPRFLFYLTISLPFRDRGTGEMYGAGGQKRVPTEFLRNFAWALPPLEQQREIADFLDRKTAGLDAIIRRRDKLIELLSDRHARAVRRCVLPRAGAAGGDGLPNGWRRVRLKRLVMMRSGEGITSEAIDQSGPFPVYGGNGVRGYTGAFTHSGTHLLIGRQGALCGNVHLARGRFWASEHAIVVTSRVDLDLMWLSALLRALDLNQHSLAAAQPGLAVDRILDLDVPLPPLPDQRAIGRFLTRQSIAVDRLIARARGQVALLRQYRQTLISHAVTGRLPATEPAGV